VAGCSSQGKPVKVKGTVTLDGKALSGATVTFMPAEGGGRPASGLTEDDGSFTLSTLGRGDGAFPGEYKITVQLIAKESTPEVAANPMTMDPKAKAAFFQRLSPTGQAQEQARLKKAQKLVPEVYSDIKRTPLKCAVPVDGKVELELRSKAR
jgi:hypothetical protein